MFLGNFFLQHMNPFHHYQKDKRESSNWVRHLFNNGWPTVAKAVKRSIDHQNGTQGQVSVTTTKKMITISTFLTLALASSSLAHVNRRYRGTHDLQWVSITHNNHHHHNRDWFFIFTTTSLIEFSNLELVCYTGFTPATLQNLLHIGIVLLGRYFIPVTNCSRLLHIVTYIRIVLLGGVSLLPLYYGPKRVVFLDNISKSISLDNFKIFKYKITNKLFWRRCSRQCLKNSLCQVIITAFRLFSIILISYKYLSFNCTRLKAAMVVLKPIFLSFSTDLVFNFYCFVYSRPSQLNI